MEWLPIADYDGTYGVLLRDAHGETIYGARTIYGWVAFANGSEVETGDYEPVKFAYVR